MSLPMGEAGTLLQFWMREVRALGGLLANEAKVLICLHADRVGGLAASDDRESWPPWELVVDEAPYRGPAGVLRDAVKDVSPDSTILVAEASRVVGTPLGPAVEAHLRQNSDATVGVNPDGSPAGLFVLKAGTLGLVPPVGFMDIKEQLLPKILASGRTVRVWRFEAPGLKSCRTRAEFLSAALAIQSARNEDEAPRMGSPGPVAAGVDAVLDPTAYIAHCAIGAGARVEAGAVLVRSVVIGTAVVAAGASISDAVITPSGVHADMD